MTLQKKTEEIDNKPCGRMTAEDRRQQILEVAVELFSQKGFRGTTTKEIALAAGVNEAIIYRHFATKSDLYDAIMDQKATSPLVKSMQETVSQAMEAGDDRLVFETMAFHMLEFHDHDESAMRLLLYSALEGHELAERIFRNHILRTHRQMAEYVQRRIDEGAFREVDPLTAVRGFLGMLISQVMHRKFFEREGGPVTNLSNSEAARRFSDLILAALINHTEGGALRASRKGNTQSNRK